MKLHPQYFKPLNPKNSWGSYEGLVKAVETVLDACENTLTQKLGCVDEA